MILKFVGQSPCAWPMLEAFSCIALFKEFMDLLIYLFRFPKITFGETGGSVFWNLPWFKSQLRLSVGHSDPHCKMGITMMPFFPGCGLDEVSSQEHCICSHLLSFTRLRSKREKLKRQLFQKSFPRPCPHRVSSLCDTLCVFPSQQPSLYLLCVV